LNFSFPFLRFSPERSTAVPAPWRHWWRLAALALGLHGLLVLGPEPPRPGGRPSSRLASPADDTPELLRLSGAADTPARISSVPLTALPPPPPALLPKGSLASPAAAPAAEAGLPLPPLPSRLPEAVAALRTLLRQPPGAALAGGDRELLVALQRRLFGLTAPQEPLAQALWQRAAVVPSPPDGLGGLPEEAELRRWPGASLPGFGAGDWHGHGLLGRQAALLVWRQAGTLWLVRLPLPREANDQTLTSS
jgi:hypothetical protein